MYREFLVEEYKLVGNKSSLLTRGLRVKTEMLRTFRGGVFSFVSGLTF